VVGTIDPDVKNDRTQEVVVGIDHGSSAVSGRRQLHLPKCDQFAWNDTLNFSSANQSSGRSPGGLGLPAGRYQCGAVTAEPNIATLAPSPPPS
jgi:hypothetical protein